MHATQVSLNPILRLKKVREVSGLSRSSIYRLAALGLFPAPIKIGVSAVGWKSADIETWLKEREDASRKTTKVEVMQ